MEFDICLMKRQLQNSYSIAQVVEKTEYLKIVQEKKYDDELDDATSVIFDICTIFEETEVIEFRIQGFGDDSWAVDCRYDLPSIIEDIHYCIMDKISNDIYDFQLRFDEQGIQRYIDVKDDQEKVVLTCHSYTEWNPVPESIQIKKDEFKQKLIKLHNDFISYASELCPLLINHHMLSGWKK